MEVRFGALARAGLQRHGHFIRAGWLFGNEIDRTANVVSTVKRALRASGNFHALYVSEIQV